MISVFNMSGRFFWASVSDYIGRETPTGSSSRSASCCIFPFLIAPSRSASRPPSIWLVYFYAATMIIFTMYGGGFATIPAYLADIFGTRYVGGIHGRLLTAWSTAGVLGPLAITSLRERAIRGRSTISPRRSIPRVSRATFGAGVDQLDCSSQQQTVTIAKLMEIAPPGTIDPTSSLYNVTMYLMAALLAVALVSNARMRPVTAGTHAPGSRMPRARATGTPASGVIRSLS